MGDTYDTEADREQQLTLLSALGAVDRALRRDECGAWRITGKFGSIHTWGTAAPGSCGLGADRVCLGPTPRSGWTSAPSPKTATRAV